MTIQAAAPDLPAAAEILRDYLGEMISRYYGRPADDAEISRHLGAGHGSGRPRGADWCPPARADGASVIRLNTRHDLIEARALYVGHGYEEIPRYGDDPLAERWFEKKLRPSAESGGPPVRSPRPGAARLRAALHARLFHRPGERDLIPH